MTPLPSAKPASDCWNVIGVRGDRSCPELTTVVHCHHCPVFAAAGRTFLDAPSPPGYLEEVEVIMGHSHGEVLLDSYLEKHGFGRLARWSRVPSSRAGAARYGVRAA